MIKLTLASVDRVASMDSLSFVVVELLDLPNQTFRRELTTIMAAITYQLRTQYKKQ